MSDQFTGNGPRPRSLETLAAELRDARALIATLSAELVDARALAGRSGEAIDCLIVERDKARDLAAQLLTPETVERDVLAAAIACIPDRANFICSGRLRPGEPLFGAVILAAGTTDDEIGKAESDTSLAEAIAAASHQAAAELRRRASAPPAGAVDLGPCCGMSGDCAHARQCGGQT